MAGETLDFVWFDEEPGQDVYFEGLSTDQCDRRHGLSHIHTPEGHE
jgi:phage terminase large subunit-like protein